MLENRIRSYWLKCLEAGETTQCIQIYGICSLFHGVLNRLQHFIGNLILYSHSIYSLIDVIVTDPSNGSRIHGMVRALSEVILTHITLVLGWIGSLHDGFLFEAGT